jgi:hypothetical protein
MVRFSVGLCSSGMSFRSIVSPPCKSC